MESNISDDNTKNACCCLFLRKLLWSVQNIQCSDKDLSTLGPVHTLFTNESRLSYLSWWYPKIILGTVGSSAVENKNGENNETNGIRRIFGLSTGEGVCEPTLATHNITVRRSNENTSTSLMPSNINPDCKIDEVMYSSTIK